MILFESDGRPCGQHTVAQWTNGRTVKVMLLINSLVRGGAETSLRSLQDPLRQRRVDARLVTLWGEGVRPSDSDVEVLCSRSDGRLSALKAVRAALVRHRPDLLHTTLFEADFVGRIAAQLEHVPVVTSLVNTPYAFEARKADSTPSWKLHMAKRLDALLAQHATTAFHAISQSAASAAIRDLGVPRDQITVVCRGRDPSLLGARTDLRRQRVRHQLGVPTHQPLVVAVAREEPQKNLQTLLCAFAALRSRLPDVLLMIAGRSGRASRHLDHEASRLGLSDKHLLRLGHRTDVPDLIVASDAFAFPSRWEGLGGAVVEAMALRTPIVASDIPPLRELLENGAAGRLVDAGDPDAWATALELSIESDQDTSARVNYAKDLFHSHYTLDRSASGMAAFYRKVLKATARR